MSRLIETEPVDINGIFCREVANTIGGQITPERVDAVIRSSSNHGFITHGIKRVKDIENIRQSGILPRTPEGGYVSYWAAGQRIFGSLVSNGNIQVQDSTFFDWSWSRDSTESTMSIAITKRDLLVRAGIVVPNGDYVQIASAVGPNLIQLFMVSVASSGLVPFNNCRESMFEMIEVAFSGDFKPGIQLKKVV